MRMTQSIPAVAVLSALLITGTCVGAALAQDSTAHVSTSTPIRHVIVVVGENRTFDNLFATYVPPGGQTIANLLSRGIVRADGTPGPNYAQALQRIARQDGKYSVTPQRAGSYAVLPQPYADGGFGQRQDVPDERFPGDMPPGPFQITRYVNFGAHTGDPAHRFFQMWQQYDGGRQDLFVWVGETIGFGGENGVPGLVPGHTYQGGVAMGFYNMQSGDAPYFRTLAERFAIADNYHQPVMGGTGPNFYALATGDVASYVLDGQPARPPANQIENPEPLPGSDNWYRHDGYRGGSYVACADRDQPGVAAVYQYLDRLPYIPFRHGNCAPGTYYLVNNYEPGYSSAGVPAVLGPDRFVVPPQETPNIGQALSEKGVSWKWYAGGRGDGQHPDKEYCTICDPFTYSRTVMNGVLRQNLVDGADFYRDVKDAGHFPAVAFITPYDSVSGHPGYAMEPSYDGFVADIVDKVRSNPELWRNTVILITFDEGGGYYDSGYIQPIDFFGDGTRIPLIAVSPWVKTGYVDHTYYDHVSILKFIEHNWGLFPLSGRSRDNLPNPQHSAASPYVPLNRPAIGDLMNLFDFSAPRAAADVSSAGGGG